MKPFFVHIHQKTERYYEPKKHNGATVFVQPGGERTVNVQVALCNKKDPYNKKIGRETALSHPCKLVNKRDLPKFLGDLNQQVFGRSWPTDDYDYVYKYLL